MLGICYDKTQTLRKGASEAPKRLRRSFSKQETYHRSGIDLTEEAFFQELGNIKPKNAAELIEQTKSALSKAKHFPIILGGEHTISYGAVKALKLKTFVVLDAHLDCEAHGDLRHDSVTRKISELLGPENVLLYGVRVFSKEGEGFIRKKKMRIANLNHLKNMKGPIYLSIDFDVLDHAILPAVGNPEPDGLNFKEIMEAVRAIAPKLMAVDFVEYTPLGEPMNTVYDTIAGKLIYGVLAEIIRARK